MTYYHSVIRRRSGREIDQRDLRTRGSGHALFARPRPDATIRGWIGSLPKTLSVDSSGSRQMTVEPPRGRLASHLSSWLRPSGIVWMAFVLGGCGPGDGLDRQAISGIVNLDGRPLNDGTILLEPETNRSGTAVGATIRRGVFVVPKDQGPVPGSYRVRIYASAGRQEPPARGQTEHSRRPMAELLPDVYNTQSELRADVNARGGNRFRFELRSDGQTDSTSHRGGSPPSSRPRLEFHHPGDSPRWETGHAPSP